jgi:hypothetical protein
VADDHAVARPGGGAPNDFGKTHQFRDVFQREIEVIARRRARRLAGERGLGLAAAERARDPKKIKLQVESKDVTGQRILTPPATANLVGLALSGGGIRSAAFCLGVLQALDAAKVLERVDYLSTVSGGGYIGCSLTAALESSDQFPFSSRLMEDEPPALQHIRNYSNYLFPNGAEDLFRNASIYGRGLVVNALLLAPFVLAASAVTLLLYSLFDTQRGVIDCVVSILNPFGLTHFFITVDLTLILVAVGIVWGIYQSVGSRGNSPEIPGKWTGVVGVLVATIIFAAFCEAQPIVLKAMDDEGNGNFFSLLTVSIKAISAIVAPVAGAISFLASKLGEFIKSAKQSPSRFARFNGWVVSAIVFAAGLVVPLFIWITYLEITYWGIHVSPTQPPCAWVCFGVPTMFVDWTPPLVAALYLIAALFFFILTLFMRPNANSLHPLYRDRLRKAFLFVPERRMGEADLPVFDKPLSKITCRNGPYHLINAALNVEESKTANRRGRNADFFLFSPMFVGSKTTGYVATRDVEQIAVGFDLATVMAASGAAISSNMGAQTNRALRATLALLNVRLGYWLRNPLRLANAQPPGTQSGRGWSEFRRRNNLLANYYFLLEMFGLLNERRKSVYLTDGGHIENLGIYELLRRRCRVIIAVDAEADPQMAFESFNTLERYALIDMGIRIDLPWQKIADESLATSKAIDDKGDAPKDKGPHCAIGEIAYPNDRKGILVYVKASLTGDENDYIFDYKKRYSDFPHETTLDQMFTEEQFEAYRALGFHAAYGLFSGNDTFAYLDSAAEQVKDLNELFGLSAAAVQDD